jgi:hypothetical protein
MKAQWLIDKFKNTSKRLARGAQRKMKRTARTVPELLPLANSRV